MSETWDIQKYLSLSTQYRMAWYLWGHMIWRDRFLCIVYFYQFQHFFWCIHSLNSRHICWSKADPRAAVWTIYILAAAIWANRTNNLLVTGPFLSYKRSYSDPYRSCTQHTVLLVIVRRYYYIIFFALFYGASLFWVDLLHGRVHVTRFFFFFFL